MCKVEIEVVKSPGEQTVGVDLGINNFAALAYEDGHSELYPSKCLKQDDYYSNGNFKDTRSASVRSHNLSLYLIDAE